MRNPATFQPEDVWWCPQCWQKPAATSSTGCARGAISAFKVPPEPAKKRVALWRRLKGMGGIYLQNGVCLLPKTDDHARRLKILENEATRMGGDAVLLETVALDRAQETKVIDRFKADRDEQYREFLLRCDDFDAEIARETAAAHFTYAELEENDVDLKKLRLWLEKIRKLDFVE